MPGYQQANSDLQLPSLIASRTLDDLRANFASVTGLPFEIRSRAGVPLFSRTQPNLCELARSTQVGFEKCCQVMANAIPAAPGGVGVYSCHGCDHLITPLILDSQIEGAIVLGPVTLKRSAKFEAEAIAKELSIEAERLRRERETVIYVPKRRAILALRFLAEVSNNLISQLTTAQDNSLLQLKYRQTARELSSLQAITDSGLSTLDINELLYTLLHRFIQALHAQAGVVLLPDESGEGLVTYATVGIPDGIAGQFLIRVGNGFVGSVAKQKKAGVTPNVGLEDSLFMKYLAERGIQSAMAAPLLSRDNLVGVVVVGKFSGQRFQLGDSVMMELLAQRAAIAVENAQLYEAERQRVQTLEELDRLRTDFISTVSHEFRTPLTIIKGFAQLLMRWEPWTMDKIQVHEHLSKIDKEVNRLTGLVDNLLTLSRVEEDKNAILFVMEPISLEKMVSEVFGIMQVSASQRKIKLEANLDTACDLVYSDRLALRNILLNLVDNAIKYSHEERVVRVSSERAGNEVKITVEDNGVGIDTGDIPSLFSKFRRLDNSRSVEAGGVGIGLYITKNLVEALGGKIWAESRERKGSTFGFTQAVYEGSEAGD